jgi:hypothetical protein
MCVRDRRRLRAEPLAGRPEAGWTATRLLGRRPFEGKVTVGPSASLLRQPGRPRPSCWPFSTFGRSLPVLRRRRRRRRRGCGARSASSIAFPFGEQVALASPFIDLVAVALLGQEELPFHREFLFLGVRGYDGVKLSDLFLWPENTSQTLCFFLSASEASGNLYGHIGVWKVNAKVGHFADNQ